MTTPQVTPGFTGLAADSTDPELIPTPRFKAAFPYWDGRYAWTPTQSARFEWIAHISVTGDPAAAAAARIQDVERFDASPGQFPPFAAERLSLKHSCGIAYTSLDNVGAVVQALDDASMMSDPWMLWVAWWWGKPVAPSRAQVVAQLMMQGVPGTDEQLRDRIAACQFLPGATFDTSVVYEPHMLHRPQGWPS